MLFPSMAGNGHENKIKKIALVYPGAKTSIRGSDNVKNIKLSGIKQRNPFLIERLPNL